MQKLISLTEAPVALPGGGGLTVALEFEDDALVGTRMNVCRLKKTAARAAKTSPQHQLVLDILEGRAKVKADSRFSELTIEGTKMTVTYPIGAKLTDHQRKVYAKLVGVRAGKTISYGELALEAGSGPRAVGNAMAHNPFPFIVPCHRVIHANGKIGGWTPIEGIDLKKALLAYESGRRD